MAVRRAIFTLVVLALSLAASADELQSKWRRCTKCQALFFAGQSSSACPVGKGAAHQASGTNYLVPFENFTEKGESGWRYCKRCQGLAFPSKDKASVCPKGGAHDHAGSGKYKLLQNPAPDVTTETKWKRCDKCGSLVFTGSAAITKCAAGGSHQTPSPDQYFMIDDLAPHGAITIADDFSFTSKGAEVQSTVVAPGVNPTNCPAGRILVSNDKIRGKTGTVAWRNLDDTTGVMTPSNFTPAPEAGTTLDFVSNDHELVSLSNGEILYITLSASKASLTGKPWFDQTYRWNFGPGARSVLATWRSTDCGTSFQYVPGLLYDSAVELDGWCGAPQMPRTYFHTDSATSYAVPLDSAAFTGEEGWRWCVQCQGLFLDSASNKVCAIGGSHLLRAIDPAYELLTATLPGMTGESGWKRCTQCAALFSSSGATSVCGAGHDGSQSGGYHMIQNAPSQTNLQPGWSWCDKCQNLFLPATDKDVSRCPNGGEHHKGAGGYQVPLESSKLPGQSGWRMCTKCRSLFFSSAPFKNVCTFGGAHSALAVKYKLLQKQQVDLPSQPGWEWCQLCGALYFGGQGWSHCPAIRPHDGTGSPDYHLATNASPPQNMQGGWRHCTKCGALHQLEKLGPQGCPLPAPDELPKFDMGGTDGPLVAVDRATDDVYLTHGCVGNTTDPTVQDHFELSGKRINKTLVARLRKGETKWTTIGTLGQNAWRTSLVPLREGALAAGIGSRVFPGFHAFGALFFTTGLDAGGLSAGWDGWDPVTSPPAGIDAGVWGHALTARMPGTNSVFVAYGDTKQGKGHGFRLAFLKDGTFAQVPKKGTFLEASQHWILPAGDSGAGIIAHLQAIDFGVGPVLLYWMDIDVPTNTIAIRGRFVTGPNEFTSDFTISRENNAPRSFEASPETWHGHYNTGGGYAGSFKYVYFPLWVEPDGVHYGRVEIAKPIFGFSPPMVATKSAGTLKTVRALKVSRPDVDAAGKEYTPRVTRP